MRSGGVRYRSLPIMALITLLWLVTAPFATAVAIARSPRGNRLVARCYWPCLALGWLGVGLLVIGGMAFQGLPQLVALAVGGPLAGLSFWARRDGGGGDGEQPPEDPAPIPPEWDWERFYSDLGELTDARGGAAREREPALL